MPKKLTCDDIWATTVERFALPLLPDRTLTLDLVAIDGSSRKRLQLRCAGIRSLTFVDNYPPIDPWTYIELSAVTCKQDVNDPSLSAVQLDIWGTVYIDLICKTVEVLEL